MYEDINYNEVMLSGKINNIYNTNNYCLFGLTCNDYSNNNCYLNLRIYNNLYYKYKDFFVKDKKVFIKGYLKTYSDKNNNIQSYIMVTKITDKSNELINGASAPHIRYDEDGVMVWNGKRCESVPPTKEELEEMGALLSEYQ